MSDDTGKQKRQHRRVPLGEPARIFLRGDASGVTGCIVNIGEGGAYVRCSTPVEVDRELVCVFALGPDENTLIKCRARVRWVAPEAVRRSAGPGFGISFDRATPETHAVLASFVSRAS